ncbi:MAG: AAA family ATPase, partial [Actinobacteria bacterium]|nr:AAA family ATPase [Actinomycetota bacterium]
MEAPGGEPAGRGARLRNRRCAASGAGACSPAHVRGGDGGRRDQDVRRCRQVRPAEGKETQGGAAARADAQEQHRWHGVGVRLRWAGAEHAVGTDHGRGSLRGDRPGSDRGGRTNRSVVHGRGEGERDRDRLRQLAAAGGTVAGSSYDDRVNAPSSRETALVADLNESQRAAVEHRGGPMLIVAGAGSGKTRVLTRRIAHLLATGDAQPGEILAITFTNKAAGEMKERVAELVGARARVMWVSTFHSACVRILRSEASRLGVKSTFTIYDQADSLRLMTMVLRDLDLDPKRYTPRSFLAQVSNLKNELIDYETYASRAQNHMEQTLAEAYRQYQGRLQRANAFDFDDLIFSAVAVLQLFP